MNSPQHHDVLVIGAGFGGLGAGIRLKRRRPRTTSRSSNARPASAAPGMRTAIRARPATSLRCSTRFRSRRIRTGRGTTRGSRRSRPISATACTASASRRSCGSRPEVTCGGLGRGRTTLDDRGALGRTRQRALQRARADRRDRRPEPPALPDLPGLADFAGPAFHTARWRDDVPIDGARIGIVGTGASAIQLDAAARAARRRG